MEHTDFQCHYKMPFGVKFLIWKMFFGMATNKYLTILVDDLLISKNIAATSNKKKLQCLK